MKWFDYLTLIIALGFVVFNIIWHYRPNKKAKKYKSCTGKCESCSLACSCYKWADVIKEYKKIQQENKG